VFVSSNILATMTEKPLGDKLSPTLLRRTLGMRRCNFRKLSPGLIAQPAG